MVAASELTYNTSATATQMAETIFGNGTTVVSAKYSGSWYSSAVYSNGDAISPFATPSDTGVIFSTGVASWFTNSSGEANQYDGRGHNSSGKNNNSDFNAIAGGRTYDASYLDVDFIPTGDVMTLQFVFSSDEYPEYAASIYNDVVGVWINDVHVPLSVAEAAPGVGEINATDNENLYIDNTGDAYNTEMDGFTVTMTLTMPVNAGEVNTIRMGIADTGDSGWDSNLLIAGDSAQTELIATQDDVTITQGQTQNVNVLGNDVNGTGGTLTITHINGVAVTAGDSVVLTTGQIVTLNADGTFDVETDTDIETVSFTYGVSALDGTGGTLGSDVGFVTVETIPCFVAGTMIRTPDGEKAVETLQEGDLVETLDDGPQPLRWIGRKVVPAIDKMAPIQIAAGTYGPHGTLQVSPQHRILLRDIMTNMFFGEEEVFVSARELVDGRNIRIIEGGTVEYVHILFDRHQVVWSNNLLTESFLPGAQTEKLFDKEVVDEICAIFPELNPKTGEGYSPAARRTLKHYEAKLLTGRVA